MTVRIPVPTSAAKFVTARILPKPAGAEAVPATIKKETVRIEVPARTVPQATVKLQPAPVKKPEPAAGIIMPVPTLHTGEAVEEESEATAHDPVFMYLSAGMLLFALIIFGIELSTFLAK